MHYAMQGTSVVTFFMSFLLTGGLIGMFSEANNFREAIILHPLVFAILGIILWVLFYFLCYFFFKKDYENWKKVWEEQD